MKKDTKKEISQELQPMQESSNLSKAVQGEAERLISQAIDKNIDVDKLERLLAMRREMKAEWAKEEYDKAMTLFQAECPTIKKTKEVDFTSKRTGFRTHYAYAPIESIVEQVKSILEKHGFSYSFNTKVNGQLTVYCKITHKFGHSQESEFSVPIDKDSFMNVQQQFASALTYAKRYTLCNALGILTGDTDDDASSIPSAKEVPQYAQKQVYVNPDEPREVWKLSYQQQKMIFAQLEEKGKQKSSLDAYIKTKFGKDSITQLTVTEANTVIEKIKSLPVAPKIEEPEAPIDLDEVEKGIQEDTQLPAFNNK